MVKRTLQRGVPGEAAATTGLVAGGTKDASVTTPEIGQTVDADAIATNVHLAGSGDPVLLLHGSGPGVTAWANWRLVMPAFGAYAGGLNFRHPAFAGLLADGRRIAHALGRDRVYAIPESRCLTGA